METNYIVVFTTVGDEKEAEDISREILSHKLAACVNIISDISSSYWWEGKIENAQEVLLIIKTKRVLFKELEALIKKHHTYEVPEIIALPIIYGSEEYLNWIDDEVSERGV